MSRLKEMRTHLWKVRKPVVRLASMDLIGKLKRGLIFFVSFLSLHALSRKVKDFLYQCESRNRGFSLSPDLSRLLVPHQINMSHRFQCNQTLGCFLDLAQVTTLPTLHRKEVRLDNLLGRTAGGS
jgi:hypothetical protein